MLWMVWASAAAAVIIVAMVLSRPRVQEPAPIETAEIAAPLPSTVSSPVATTSPALPHPTARPRQTRAFEVDDRPTQFFGPVSSDGFFGARMSTAGTFPSASPLSDQEQMLVAMVSRMTGQQQRALAEALEASRIPDPLPKSVPESSVRPASEIKNTH
jgi:hypothetical protein